MEDEDWLGIEWWKQVSVPTWYFAFPPTAAYVILHRRDRRLAHRLTHNLCARCGYSRAGLAEDAPCPECGAEA